MGAGLERAQYFLCREEKGLTQRRWLEESHENSVAWGSWSHLGRGLKTRAILGFRQWDKRDKGVSEQKVEKES